MVTEKNKPIFAVLLDNFRGGYQYELVSGFEEEAVKQDVNLIYFVGKSLNSPLSYEKEQNAVYKLIDKEYIDGIIMAAPVFRYQSPNQVKEFCKQYKGIPIASIGFDLEEEPSVVLDSRKGFMDLLNHLYTEHGFRKPAFIHGPESHPEALDRFQCFQAFLKEKGLECDDRKIVYGDFTRQSGISAIRVLVSERKLVPGKDFDVLVVSNDVMAAGAIYALESLGFLVPDDLGVTGFDDDNEGRWHIPALTTVHQPIRQKGREALRSLIENSRSGKAEVKMLPAELVIRRSCGCVPEPVFPNLFSMNKQGDRPLDEDSLIRMVRDLITNPEFDSGEWLEEIAGNFVSCFLRFLKEGDEKAFRNSFDGLLIRYIKAGGNVSYWYRVLSYCYTFLPEGQSGNILWQANIQVSRKFRQQESQGRLESERFAGELRNINEEIKGCMTFGELSGCLRKSLPLLDIEKFYLLFHDNIKQGGQDLRLIMGYKEKGIMEKTALLKNMSEVVKLYFSGLQRFSCVMLPLVFGQKQYGIQLAGVNLYSWVAYEDIRVHISSTLKSFYLLKEAEEVNLKLKETREQLVETTRRAGMSQVTGNILVNVANILTSTNASVDQIKQILNKSKLSGLKKANSLLRENLNNLYSFLLSDEKGKLLLTYYLEVGKLLDEENENLQYEFSKLYDNIEKINQVVSSQNEAGGSSIHMTINVARVIEDVLFLENNNINDNEISVTRSFDPEEFYPVYCPKSKILQVFVILIENAIKNITSFEPTDIVYVAREGVVDKENHLSISIEKNAENVYVTITDTGKGLDEHSLKNLFQYDFCDEYRTDWTGLHTCVNFLEEMEAKIYASSNGPGTGATFKVIFPRAVIE